MSRYGPANSYGLWTRYLYRYLTLVLFLAYTPLLASQCPLGCVYKGTKEVGFTSYVASKDKKDLLKRSERVRMAWV